MAQRVRRPEARTGTADEGPGEENGRLKKAVAELTLDKQILKEASRETSKPRTPAPMRGASVAAAGNLATARLPYHRPAPFHPAQAVPGPG
jgi:hypothetical protein